jgi:hypothetical protein
MPECKKEYFFDGHTESDCYSDTVDGKTWYYYNWAYVNKHKDKMCPAPWRVPTKEDFDTLVNYTNYNTLIDAWGYGAGADGSDHEGDTSYAFLWSSSEDADYMRHCLYYDSANLYITSCYSGFDLNVRCVK